MSKDRPYDPDNEFITIGVPHIIEMDQTEQTWGGGSRRERTIAGRPNDLIYFAYQILTFVHQCFVTQNGGLQK